MIDYCINGFKTIKQREYNGLVEMKKGRPSKGVPQMKKEEAKATE